MFTIDFTKPFLYKDVIYFNQGNLATNNILRCKLITGGDTTLEGYIATVAFKTLSHPEINASATIVDEANCVIDIKFPSNALEVGVNELEIVLNKGEGIDKVVTPSPVIKYEVWQCITTGNGIQGDNSYPILIDLIADVNNATVIANNAIDKANTSLNKANKMISDTNNVIAKANEAIDNTNNAKDKALEVIGEVEKAIAAGTQDLEVKKAREDSFGVTHDSLFQRLESDLKIDEKPLKQEVLDLAGLKEVQEMTYSTDKGCLICKETKNGTIKDLKLYGKSLLNKIGKFNTLKWVNNSLGTVLYYDAKVSSFNLEIGKEYTIKVFGFGGNVRDDRIIISNVNESKLIQGSNYTFKFTLNTFNDVTDGFIHFYNKDGKTIVQSDYENAKILLLEGDHTQNLPSYFEGIASIGTGVDKIEVSSCNENLFNGEFISEYATTHTYDGTDLIVKGEWYSKFSLKNLPKCTDCTLCAIKEGVDLTNAYIRIYFDDNTTLDNNLSDGYITFNTKSGVKEINFYCGDGNSVIKTVTYKNVGIYIGSEKKKFIKHKQDKKPILFKDIDGTWKPIKELRGLDTVCDTVEHRKYFNRVGKQVIDNVTLNTQYANLDYAVVPKPTDAFFYNNYIKHSKIITDANFNQMLNAISSWDTLDLVGSFSTAPTQKEIWFGVPKGTTLEQAKEMLVGKTMLYSLAKEKVFEVNPLFLEAYEGETMGMVNSGVINAPMEFKIASYISNLVLLNQKRIKDLENEIYKSQDVQDMMILENDLRLMDIEFALMESMPIKLNLRSDDMFRGVTEFEFLKGRILSGSHTDEYLEKCINKYKKAGRLTDEEYDILYDMIYPPVYDVLAEK